MSRPGDLADWLRAVAALRPSGDEEISAIARVLGLQVKGGHRTVPAAPRRAPSPATPVEPGAARSDEPVSESKPRRRLESVLVPQHASRNPAPQWLATARSLESPTPAHIRPSIPLEPLFPARTVRAILSGAMATPSEAGPLDMTQVIERLSRAEVILEIPRVTIPTLVRGVQLLIDRGDGMQPFSADQTALRSALASVVGRDRTEVLYFDSVPSWGAGTGPKDDWPDYRTPPRGTPVVVLTDLGISQPPGVAGLAGVADWRAFAQVVARAGCPLLALVPYPSRRWPAALLKSITIIQWDRATTASVVRRSIPAGLRTPREM
jgi:hypothetical protein